MNERKSRSDGIYTERMVLRSEAGTIERVRDACAYWQTASDFIRRAIEHAIYLAAVHAAEPSAASKNCIECGAKHLRIAELEAILAKKRWVKAEAQRAWSSRKKPQL